MYPWYDYGNRVSPLKLTVFVALFLPGLWVATALASGWLGARPLNEAIHQIGLWTIRLIFVALAVTPLRQILQWPRLVVIRRMVGVAAFAYGLVHLSLYVVDQNFNLVRVASEIVLRIYLTIGFAALLGLAALAATSTDGMVRRLGGRRWQRLHRIVYVIGVLAVVHYCFQSKLEQWEPTIMAGLLSWLLGYRVLLHFVGMRGRVPVGWVVALGAAVPLVTALGEATYFHFAFHVASSRVLQANLSLVTGLRPAPVVLAITAAATLAALIRAPAAKARGGRARVAPKPAAGE